ncbi:hypothetical protein QJS04_geneDACA012900 [Acorus gramineus]|uniref:Uncharacterized protein n=1 Tax=Acorus gramineus TaxID=55184 RepID=A0AAV9BHP8_ACOGR|nr:hypothetical protein QJS04_geneDACA012900 [Acorus gramineus]
MVTTILCILLVSVSFFSTSLSTSPLHESTMSMESSEMETLFKVMELISSDRDWRVTNPDPCSPHSSWPGLECKPSSDNPNLFHVSRLNFGTPPNPTCKPTSTFPSLVFTLPSLQSLFFFNCFTHTNTTLSLPPHFPSSPTLRQLSLKSNQALMGPIPPQISSLKSLHTLTLSQNNLHGKIPTELSTLSSLLHLDLSYNSLTGFIPGGIGGLRSLLVMDLSYNSLSGPIPASIGELGLLQKLDLSSNLLSGEIPASLSSLGYLSFLALSNNSFKGGFPASLTKLQNLQYFIMDDNPMFVPLPSELGSLSRLQELRLANSGYSGPIPESFGSLSKLTTLSLQNNRLTGGIPEELGGLPHIYHLNLSKNMLNGVVPFNESFMRRLGRSLDLSGNPGLCVNGEDGFEGAKAGIGVCGNSRTNGTVVMQGLPLKSSCAPVLLSNLLLVLLGSLSMF